ncbi:AlpA family transcriptional regulator [Bradyrhizobium sp. Arg816]|uniref:helix-turn-helix transcriptional regulator n=1 Tax=Bradyrhizobium sp. Arg816 TaxID=2998491 RepID=UPI00249D98BC|nr:hypothetical protein [Bradyrhizobium sp. Arg816]MDI3564945.1 hypothetical protein [Bradyrhizobium sp. Arg816]
MSAPEPRLMTGREAAAYCGVTVATWAKWVALGIVPPPLPGTRRWDRKALDLALDKMSGIESAIAPQEEDPLEKWIRKDAAKQARTSINDRLRPRYRWEDDFDAAWSEHLAEYAASYANKPATETEKLRQGLWDIWKDLKGTALAANKKKPTR